MRIVALEEHFATRELIDACVDAPYARSFRLLSEYPPIVSAPDFVDRLLEVGEKRITDMDASGIDVQVVSHTVPGPEDLPAETAVRLSAAANDALAKAVASYPDRFAGFATLPMPDPAAAATELRRAVNELGFVGTMINGHVGGRYLDDKFFWPVLEAAASLNVPVYLHPNRPPQPVVDASYSGFTPAVTEWLATGTWGWHVETGLHALRLILGGVFDRFPDLQVVIGHMGEALPSMIWRANRTINGVSGLAKPLADYFTENFYVTTSGVFDYAPFAAAYHALGIDRLLFSVDYPYSRNAEGRAFLDHLPLSLPDKEKVAHANADRLLRLR